MKKSFILSIAAAILVFAGCAKEESAPVAKKGTFSVSATILDSKMTNEGLTSSWSANDDINLFHSLSDGTSVSYISDGLFKTENGDGLFTGTLGGELAEGSTYEWFAFYPYNSNIKEPGARTSGYITVGSTASGNQTQFRNNNMGHLAGDNMPLYGNVTAVAPKTPELVMHRLTSVVALNVTNGTDEPLTVSELSFTIANQDIVGTYYIDITGDAPVYTPSGDNFVSSTARLKVNNGEAIAPKESAKFYFGIKPVEINEKNPISVSVSDASGKVFLKENISVAANFAAGAIKTVNVTVDGFSSEKGMSKDNPYTVSEALALYDGTLPTNEVFVKGIVSKVSEINTQYGNATYFISDDGSEKGGQLEIYRGRYLDGKSFTSTGDLGAGDEVIVKGILKLFYETQEMDANNEIVYLKRVPFFTVNPETKSVAAEGETFTFTVSCLADQAWEVFPQQSWVTCEPESGTGPATVTVTVAENAGAARTCDIDFEVGSGLDKTVSISQAGVGATTETLTGTFTLSADKQSLSLTTASGITVVQETGTSSTAPNVSYNTATTLRIYDGNTITFSGKTIKRIVFTHASDRNGGANTSANVGTYTRGTTSSTWEGEATSVTITNTKAEGAGNIQIRPTKIEITYVK